MSDYTPFQLAASLSGHEQDVKAVCSAGEDGVISAARDNSVRMWFRTASNAFGNSKIFLGHSRFVNSVAYIGPSAEYPSGLIVSGSSDKIIHVWDVENAGDPIFSLIDHAENVCALDITPSGHIVSGSWDKTSKLWRNQQLVYTLKGHEAAVWAVLAISDQIIITGSADKTIVRWDDGVRTNTFYGHTDCVRALAEIKGMGFVSCSNDSSLRIWNLDGQCLQELYGHQSFVYSVDILPTGEIISSGEDRSVKVWKDGECVQTISHPAISVWCTAAMPNGDIISGASDGIVRVFSRVSERIADAEKLKEYNELLASQAIPTNQVGDLKKDNLPGKEALSTPGEKEGQVLMVKDGIKVEAYQWSSANQKWDKIGEVVDAVGQQRRQLYNGKEYDYVFTVDIGDGIPPLRLPYNITENPYQAAQQFIWANSLPQSYLDQVANFIRQNTTGAVLGAGSGNVDPYTGTSRYTAAETSTSSTSSAPGRIAAGIDPWTGSTTSVKAAASDPIIPCKKFMTYEQANLPPILKKIQQFSADLQPQGLNLTAEETKSLEVLISYLQDSSNSQNNAKERQEGLSVIKKIMTSWPYEKRFPGLDLFRLHVIRDPIPVTSSDESILQLVYDAVDFESFSKNASATKEQEINLTMGLRTIANLFETKIGREILTNKGSSVLDKIFPTWNYISGKGVRLALITVLLNYSVAYLERPDEDAMLQMIAAIIEILESTADPEAIYRTIVTLGTLISKNQAAKEATIMLGAEKAIQRVSAKVSDDKVQSVIGKVNKMLST